MAVAECTPEACGRVGGRQRDGQAPAGEVDSECSGDGGLAEAAFAHRHHQAVPAVGEVVGDVGEGDVGCIEGIVASGSRADTTGFGDRSNVGAGDEHQGGERGIGERVERDSVTVLGLGEPGQRSDAGNADGAGVEGPGPRRRKREEPQLAIEPGRQVPVSVWMISSVALAARSRNLR